MLAVFVGILIEQWAVQRCLDVLEGRELGDYPVVMGSYGGKPVLLCRTGLGRARGAEAVQAVLQAYAPTAFVSLRMAGSVREDLRVGDLVLCERSYLCRDGEAPARPLFEADRRLMALAQQATRGAGLRYMLRDGLTLAPVKARPLDRQAALSKYTAAVVDTEGYWLVEAARARGIPFLAVRSALGRSLDRVPEILDLTAERGVLSPGRIGLHVLRRPARLPGLMLLSLSVRTAARRLGAFMAAFLHEWSMEP